MSAAIDSSCPEKVGRQVLEEFPRFLGRRESG